MAYMKKRKRSRGETLTVDDLTEAIKNSVEHTGMEDEAAQSMAKHVLNFFGYSDRIIDNVLGPEDRDAFYMLEDSGLLTTEREETTLYDGREWRIHYWLFKKDRIHELADYAGSAGTEPHDEDDSFYSELPDDLWARDGPEDDSEEETTE